MKLISKICLMCSFVAGCVNINTPNEKRRGLISDAIVAIARYDTSSLYNLIDTGYAFGIDGKDGILYKVSYIHNRFKVCGTSIIDSAITIRDKAVHSKEYRIPYCRGENGEIVDDSFDLLFTFSDYDNNKKIKLLDVTIYRQAEPTLAP